MMISSNLRLVLSILLVVALLALSRSLMYAFNLGLFADTNFKEYLRIFLLGLRFDVSAVLYLNGIFIFFALALNFLPKSRLLLRLNFIIFFCIPNIIALGFNLADVIYYRFTLKRMTADIFDYLEHAGDMGALMPQFLRDFWYVTLVGFVFFFILVWVANRLLKPTESNRTGTRHFLSQFAIALIVMFFAVIGMRGGFQLKPIDIAQAGMYVSTNQSALILNTPFTIMKTIGKTHLEETAYFKNEKEMEAVFSSLHKTLPEPKINFSDSIADPNIVIILLESFSAEHSAALCQEATTANYQGYTPFLDSLICQSVVFEGFANGKRSIESIPAILSSVPSLMNNDFISSVYSNNQVSSLASILKKKGYISYFFHGGTNGTMGFDTYAKASGFDKYLGREEFDDESHYDGHWGIFDEPFLQFAAGEINKSDKPFFSVIFTLSSHHPYTIPSEYKGRLRTGPLPIHQAIHYADQSLKQFFKTASAMPWFQNTLFIITSDHTSEPVFPYYKSFAGSYAIPMIFYHPAIQHPQKISKIVQHADIMPSILHLFHWKENFIAFGQSAFCENKSGFSITFLNGRYQLIKDNHLFHFDGKNAIALYDLKRDSMCKNNILESHPSLSESMTRFTQAIIQQYNYRMIHNKLKE